MNKLRPATIACLFVLSVPCAGAAAPAASAPAGKAAAAPRAKAAAGKAPATPAKAGKPAKQYQYTIDGGC